MECLHTMSLCMCKKSIVTVRAGTRWKHDDGCLSRHGFNEATVPLVISSICHLVLVWTWFLDMSTFQRGAACYSWLAESQPHDQAYPLHVQEPCFSASSLHAAASEMTDAARQRQDVVMVQQTETTLLIICMRHFVIYHNIS